MRLNDASDQKNREYDTMRYYLAIDIGASSGRHIVGWTENGEIRTEEVYRFVILC